MTLFIAADGKGWSSWTRRARSDCFTFLVLSPKCASLPRSTAHQNYTHQIPFRCGKVCFIYLKRFLCWSVGTFRSKQVFFTPGMFSSDRGTDTANYTWLSSLVSQHSKSFFISGIGRRDNCDELVLETADCNTEYVWSYNGLAWISSLMSSVIKIQRETRCGFVLSLVSVNHLILCGK